MAISQQCRYALGLALKSDSNGAEVADILDIQQAISSTEAGYLDGVTAGTATASKVLVLDSSKGIATITSATITTVTTNNVSGGGSTIAFTDRITTTDGVSSGTARVVGGLAYSNVAASTTVGATTAETLFDVNYTIPANTLKAGTKVKVRYAGFGVAGSGTDTFAHKLYIGGSAGTALLTSAAAQLATNATFTGEAELICRTAGTTGTFISFGTYKQSSAEGTMTVKDDYVASTTINTTANQAIAVTGTWNTTNATSARLDILYVEIH